MTGFHSASEYSKTCFVVLVSTCVVMALSYGAPYWTTVTLVNGQQRDNAHAGLWHGCTWGNCYERWDYWTSSWIKATQAFMTLGIITIFFATVSLGAFIFHRYFDEDKRMIAVSLVLTFATTVFTFVAVCTWVSNEHFGNGEIVNWAFVLACGCCLSTFVTGFFLLMELRRPVK